MSHDIETRGDLAAFVANRTPAWHMLGTVVEDDNLTVADAMRLAYLDGWNVHLEPLMVPVGDDTDLRFIGVPGMSATVRTNPFDRSTFDALGVVSNNYAVAQVEDVAEFAQNVADEGLVVDAAGSLNGGRRYFFTFRLPTTIDVGGADPIQTFFMVASSHDGSLANTGIVTPVRVVCQNTLTASLGTQTEQRFSFRHVGEGLKGKVDEARQAIGTVFAAQDEWAQNAAEWLDREVTAAEFDKIVTGLFPLDEDAPAVTITRTEEKRDTYRILYEVAPTQANIRGTAWAALMAATEQQEWFGRTIKGPAKAAEWRLDSPALLSARRSAVVTIGRTLGLTAGV